MKNILINCMVSICCALATVITYGWMKPDTVNSNLAVLNYDVANVAGLAQDPNEADENYTALRESANKLTAVGFVVLDSRALVSYPPELEIPLLSKTSSEEASNGQ